MQNSELPIWLRYAQCFSMTQWPDDSMNQSPDGPMMRCSDKPILRQSFSAIQ